MATYTISATATKDAAPIYQSVVTNVTAFSQGTSAADTLTVEQGAYLISTGDFGAALDNQGAWKVTVDGTVHGPMHGIHLKAGNAALSTIAVGVEGSVVARTDFGGIYGAAAMQLDSSANVKNEGLIVSDVTAIVVGEAATATITNLGTIRGDYQAIDGSMSKNGITVVNSGTIAASSSFEVIGSAAKDSVTNSGTIDGIVTLGGGDDSLTNTGTISGQVLLGEGANKLDNKGQIGSGVLLGTGNDTIANAGTITGALNSGDGNDTVTTSGTIGGFVKLGAGNDSLTNSGTISQYVELGDGDDSLTNSGTIAWTVDLGYGTNKLDNKGHIVGGVLCGDGADTVVNSKTIGYGVTMGSEFDTNTNSLTNSGSIDGSYAGAAGNDVVKNTGTLTSHLRLFGGDNTVQNSGSVGMVNGQSILAEGGVDKVTNSGKLAGSVELGAGDDVLSNTGAIGGGVQMGDGNDVLTSTGTIGGSVYLGAGNDKFTGGAKSETVHDGDGADTVKLGAGDDKYVAAGATAGKDGDGADLLGRYDFIDAGTGIDTYDASGATGSLLINIDAADHAEGGTAVGKSTARGLGISGAEATDTTAYDRVLGFENAYGGSNDDLIYGTIGANTLSGNGGNDKLFGFAGNDTISGGDGNDLIVGGLGADKLSGGAGGDIFRFAKGDSGTSAATRDVISDFDGLDLIDISSAMNSAGAALTYINGSSLSTPAARFTAGVTNQLRSYWTGDGLIFELDANGDAKADLSLKILGSPFALDINQSHFIGTST